MEEAPRLQALLPQRPEALAQVGHGVAVPPRAQRRRPLLRQRLRHARHGRGLPRPAPRHGEGETEPHHTTPHHTTPHQTEAMPK